MRTMKYGEGQIACTQIGQGRGFAVRWVRPGGKGEEKQPQTTKNEETKRKTPKGVKGARKIKTKRLAYSASDQRRRVF